MKKRKIIAPAILATVILIYVFTVTATVSTCYMVPIGDDSNACSYQSALAYPPHATETMVGDIAPSVDYDDVMGAYEYANTNDESIVIEHTCTNFSQVPEKLITTAKDNLHIAYGHTSHGSQIITGMDSPPTTCGCIGSTQNFTCGDTITESCTLTCNLNSNDTCFYIGADNITIDGAGHSITGNATGCGIFMTGKNNITIKNINICNFHCGIDMCWYSTNNRIINNTIIENDYGVEMFWNLKKFWSDSNNKVLGNMIINNNIEDVHSDDNRGDKIINNNIGNIYLSSSSNFIIANNHIGIMDLDDALHNYICDNIIRNSMNLEGDSSNNDIINNSIKEGIYLKVSHANTIANNSVKYVRLEGSSNNRIINNTINRGKGIYLGKGFWCFWSPISLEEMLCVDRYSKFNEIKNNIINSSHCNGIVLSKRSDNTKIINNVISLSGNCGIHIEYSSGIEIINNSISANNESGVYLFRSHSDNITNNCICSNQKEGFCLYGSSNNNLTKNEISLNKKGIYLTEESGTNQIINNSIKKNEYGVYISSGSSHNNIYHNNFINNTIQAEENSNISRFDNGPIIGGNYWSDHECEGNPSNGSQPYIIPILNNQDKYPFENENGWSMMNVVYPPLQLTPTPTIARRVHN